MQTVDWSSAVVVFVAGFLNVFFILALLMYAMRGIGVLLKKIAREEGEPRR